MRRQLYQWTYAISQDHQQQLSCNWISNIWTRLTSVCFCKFKPSMSQLYFKYHNSHESSVMLFSESRRMLNSFSLLTHLKSTISKSIMSTKGLSLLAQLTYLWIDSVINRYSPPYTPTYTALLYSNLALVSCKAIILSIPSFVQKQWSTPFFSVSGWPSGGVSVTVPAKSSNPQPPLLIELTHRKVCIHILITVGSVPAQCLTLKLKQMDTETYT